MLQAILMVGLIDRVGLIDKVGLIDRVGIYFINYEWVN